MEETKIDGKGNEKMTIGKDPIEYSVTVKFYGLPAYVVDELVGTGLYGNNRAEVVRRLASDQIVEELRSGLLKKLGITIEDAKKKNYIPVKEKK